MAKSAVIDKTYAEMLPTLPPPAAGKGRFYIYRTAASTNLSLAPGIGILKNSSLCTVDDTAFEIIWEAFKYFDLPEGPHEITCGDDVLKKAAPWGGKEQYQKGMNRIQVSISNGADSFVRVESIRDKPHFEPVIVASEQARTEMKALPYQKSKVPLILVGRYPSSECGVPG